VDAAEALLADGRHGHTRRQAVHDGGARPTVTAYGSDDEEASQVAARVRAAHRADVPWSSIAVLYRTNAQSAPFEAALGALGVPYRVRGPGAFLARPEVRAAIDALRAAVQVAPGRRFAEHLVDLDAMAADDDASAERSSHVAALARLGREYVDAEPGAASLDGFLAFLAAALRDDAPTDGDDAVELLTFHRAKGLEFHTVFVTGVERGLVPIAYAETPAARHEERRLLYVALTRAERALHCSWARTRLLGSRAMRRSPSPWLAVLDTGTGDRPPPRPTAPAGIAAARRHLGAPNPTADDTLFRALQDWRRRLAQASGVPAYVIFPDTTLRAVAETRPASRDALLALPGVGPVKLERHGPAVLELVRAHD
jgi:DNA helicase-2/ATP-dependent DNA helicase PcrA